MILQFTQMLDHRMDRRRAQGPERRHACARNSVVNNAEQCLVSSSLHVAAVDDVRSTFASLSV